MDRSDAAVRRSSEEAGAAFSQRLRHHFTRQLLHGQRALPREGVCSFRLRIANCELATGVNIDPSRHKRALQRCV